MLCCCEVWVYVHVSMCVWAIGVAWLLCWLDCGNQPVNSSLRLIYVIQHCIALTCDTAQWLDCCTTHGVIVAVAWCQTSTPKTFLFWLFFETCFEMCTSSRRDISLFSLSIETCLWQNCFDIMTLWNWISWNTQRFAWWIASFFLPDWVRRHYLVSLSSSVGWHSLGSLPLMQLLEYLVFRETKVGWIQWYLCVSLEVTHCN